MEDTESLKPLFNLRDENPNYLKGEEISGLTKNVAIMLPDDSLSALGYWQGDTVEVRLGDIWQGDLAAILTAAWRWHVGFVFFCEGGVRLTTSRTDNPPRYYPLDYIYTAGRVVKREGRAVIQAGITLPTEGVDRIRFRFRL